MAESEYKPGKLSYVFDPFEMTGINVKSSDRKAALDEIADYVQTSMLSYVGDATSPVAGHGKFAGLSPAYKKVKAKEGARPIANLELFGDMLDALNVVRAGPTELAVQITGDQAEKADGHCKLTGRENNLPERRFIPDATETFKRDIISGIKTILRTYAEDVETVADVQYTNTAASAFDSEEGE